MSLCTDSVSGGSDRSGRRLDRRSGQIIVLATLSLSVLFALVGLSVDLGYSYYIKSACQAAADSAAQAAAVYAKNNGYDCAGSITCGTTYNCASPPTSPSVTAFEAGCLYAQANGFTNTGNQAVSLIANNTAPPIESGNSPSLWIQANVSETVPHYFLFWSGFHSGSVAAQAVAAITTTPNSACTWVLDNGSTSGAFSMNGTTEFDSPNCALYVNSSNSKAVDMVGNSTLITSATYVVGGCHANGATTVSPACTTGQPVAPNPLAGLPAPTVSTHCDYTNHGLTGNATEVLYPGVYCGGISASSSGSMTMNPGIYILNGGGFQTTGSGTITGSHVMFFLTGQHGYTNGPMSFGGGQTINLTAPDSGTYQGILFYQDPSATYASGNSMGGNVTFNGSGTFYFPTTSLTFAGTPSASKVGFVVWDLTLKGNSTIEQDTTGIYTGLAKISPGLIE